MLHKKLTRAAAMLFSVVSAGKALAADVKVGQAAPLFSAQTQTGESFDLKSRKGSWTILYFYPKADTPGCTKQACTLRDHIDEIRAQGADVFGISADSVADQAAFHKKHRLNFTLIADPEGRVVELYGAKMPLLKMSKRWTFIVDPELQVRDIIRDVDPVRDSLRLAELISKLKKASP